MASRIERELQRRAGWWDRVLEKPLLWGLVAAVACSWLVIPRTAPRLPLWEPGDVATFDVVVQSDQAIPDIKATERLREEARAAVLPVYDLDPGVRQEFESSISVLFSVCRDELANGGLSRPELAQASGLHMDDDMVRVLQSAECSADLEGALLRVVGQVYSRHLLDDRRELERRGQRGVVVRTLPDRSEKVVSLAELSSAIDLRTELGPALRASLLEEAEVRRRWIKPVTRFLETNLAPDLVYNRAETSSRVEAAAAGVTPRLQSFKRGQVLIRRGDTVSPEVARLLRSLNEQRMELTTYASSTGTALLVVIIVLGWWQLILRLTSVGEVRVSLSTVFLLMVVFTGLERLGVFLSTAVALNSQSPALSSSTTYLWALPHAAGPVVALLLLGLTPAILFAVSQALLVGLMLGGDLSVTIYALAAGLVGVMAAQRYKERSVFTRVGLVVGLANLVVMGVLLLYGGMGGSPSTMAVEGVAALLGGPLAMGTVTFLLPVFEALFGITTDLRLLELSNQNLPLLKELSLKAPGTYQHSLAVGNLAEAGANAVGANGLLLRVCSYYHDVGKLAKPNYFVENQRGENPHDNLAPSMSALIIKNHVKEGLEMARKERLPLPIRQAIATHHGTKLIRYFYSRAKELAGEDNQVLESEYRYPGPRPHTKELGILLLADAVEAAARTLDSPSPAKIRAMISRIVNDALEDGQLDDSDLTFKELEEVSQAFLGVLTNMFHSRIDYPGFDFNRRERRSDSDTHLDGTPSGRSGG